MLDQPRSSVFTLVLLKIFGIFVSLFGAAMFAGGLWLVALGGSAYYVVAGALFLASGILLFMRRRSGAWIYGIALALTLAWAIWEVGFDFWPLLPRLLMPVAMGLWVLLPWTQRPLRDDIALPMVSGSRWGSTAAALGGVVLAVAIGSIAYSATYEVRPSDPRFQTGFGPFPQEASYSYTSDVGEDWPHFGGDQAGSRYSPLANITRDNVDQLEVAWSVDVGDMPGTSATPLKVGDTLYTCNNQNQVFALDAASGEQRWTYDGSNGYGGTCRGVAYFAQDTTDQNSANDVCFARILTGTSTARLIALDALTGELCPDFGNAGIVDLQFGMADAEGNTIGGYYRVTSAPTIVAGKAVVGGWVTDNQYVGEPSGVVRAFDVITGEFAWAWDMGRPNYRGLPPEGESFTPGTPNSWAPMSVDEDLDLVYLPTGNAGPDFFGAQRRDFDDRFSTAVVALDGRTGRLRWSFQTKNHDIWDHDVPAQPTLLDLRDGDGVLRKALIQPTKQGEIYVVDRLTGVPIFDVTEHPAPQDGAVPEERVAATQPFSDNLPSFRGPDLREADMWGISPFDQLMCRIQFRQMRYDGPNTPPGVTTSLIYPSTLGAINWGSVSIDPVHGVMLVNSNRMVSTMRLIPRVEADEMGVARQGEFGNPAELLGPVPQDHTPYAAELNFWLTPLGVPCIAPPYGLLSAVDLNTGKMVWTQDFGTALDSGPAGIGFPFAAPMGVPNYGGSMVTSTGILFIGATRDSFFHAYDVRSGELLWRMQMPGGVHSVPVTYTVDGRQYVVVSAGGSPSVGSRTSTKMVALALPQQ